MGIWEAACGPRRRGVCAERGLPTTGLAASSQRIYRSVANSHILAKGSPMRTLPLAQIGPAKINVALRQVAEAPGIVAAKTLSAVYRIGRSQYPWAQPDSPVCPSLVVPGLVEHEPRHA